MNFHPTHRFQWLRPMALAALNAALLAALAPFASGQERKAGDDAKAAKDSKAARAAEAEKKNQRSPAPPPERAATPPAGGLAPDAIQEAQTPREVPKNRPEQKLSTHDASDVFLPSHAPSSSPALKEQPEEGKINGFDFARDPLNAKEPMTANFDEAMKADAAAKPGIMAKQRALLESRYHLEPKLDPEAKMSRGKPLPVGPTARLPEGSTWEQLAEMAPDQIKQANRFPYPSLPHPKHTPGGQVFPQIQIEMFPRLQRFDVDHDIPEAFLPEFPPAIFLQNRPELGDVSRGEVVSINNFHRLFKDLVTPVQLDGLRMLLTPMPQEEFNATDDRKSP
ncbi:MAG TPA: hypothetical protein VD994_16450, partial [Prosthecobacter sp.]|nr:hypothetical protein [Prosthecobacter sp.]